MANEPISALTLFTSYSTADEVEILDVSDTTFASTGTNKRIPFSTLLTMAGVGTAGGVTTVAGGGTGLTAVGSADQLLGVAHTGGALEYKTLTAGSNITITPGGRLDHDCGIGRRGRFRHCYECRSLAPTLHHRHGLASLDLWNAHRNPRHPDGQYPLRWPDQWLEQQLQRSAPLCRPIFRPRA